MLFALPPGPPFVRLSAFFYNKSHLLPELLPYATPFDSGIFNRIMQNAGGNNFLRAPCSGKDYAHCKRMGDVSNACPFSFLLLMRFHSDFNSSIDEVRLFNVFHVMPRSTVELLSDLTLFLLFDNLLGNFPVFYTMG
jgi:hypothetical protein